MLYCRPKPRKVLVTGARTSTPASHDVQNGVPLMPNFAQVVSGEMLHRSPGAAVDAKQHGDIISLDDNVDYHLPR